MSWKRFGPYQDVAKSGELRSKYSLSGVGCDYIGARFADRHCDRNKRAFALFVRGPVDGKSACWPVGGRERLEEARYGHP